MYLVVSVDNILNMCRSVDKVRDFKQSLLLKFFIHDLREVNDFLEFFILRARKGSVIWRLGGHRLMLSWGVLTWTAQQV